MHAIVGVHACHQGGRRLFQAPVEDRHQTAAAGTQQPQARIPPGQRHQLLHRVVIGTVIHGQQLEIREGLAENGLDAVAQGGPGISKGQ